MKIAKGILVWAKLSVITLIVASATTVTNGALPFTVTNLPATDITASSAQVNGVVNPSGKKARYIFQTRAPGKKRFLRATPWTIIPKGQSNVEVSGQLTGLAADSTYEYRIVAFRGLTRRVSEVLTFTATDPGTGTPAVTTTPATVVTTSSANLNGTASPNGAEALTVYFEYGTTTAYGTPTPSITVSANNSEVVSAIGSLANDTTYHFRIVGSNSLGVIFGADQSFSTSASAPIATTLPASAITTSGATLNGTVNPNGSDVSARFEYGTTTDYGTPTALVNFPAAGGAASLTATIGGLLPNTIYHYRVVINGNITGADQTFTTATLPTSAPTVTTTAATGASVTTATLNGTVNPNGSATKANFLWGTTTAYGNFTDVVSLSAGDSAEAIVANLAGLTPNQTYHFRLVATNSNGTTLGTDVTFMTSDTPPSAPSAVTAAATDVTATTATLNGSVNPNRAETTVRFQYGLNISYDRETAEITLPAGNGVVPLTAALTGLAPNTTYHFRIIGINSVGTSPGADFTFTTPPSETPPASATTTAATSVGTTTATINGTVNPNGGAKTAYLQFGTTTSYELGTIPRAIDAGNADVLVSADLEGLSPGTEYHFRLVVDNGPGVDVTEGADLTFTTLGAAIDVRKRNR
jgi:trimeric autotransporter adhesin